MSKRPYLLAFPLAPMMFWASAWAAPVAAQQDSALAKMGEAMVAELGTANYGHSRCLLASVFSTDGITVAVGVDREFSAGDVVTAVGNEPLDATAKKPVRELLLKHSPTEIVPITIRRGGKVLVVPAKCSDSKPVYDLLLEAAVAASKNDAMGCADKMDALSRLQRRSYGQLQFSYQCYLGAHRFVNFADSARFAYDQDRELIAETKWSPDELGSIRGRILSVVDSLQKHDESMLGNDLRQLYDQAVMASNSPP